MKRVEQNKCNNSYDPFIEWEKHCKHSGTRTPVEQDISNGIFSFSIWVKNHSIPLAFISGLLFFGSLRIADSSQRNNARLNTLEIIQIESLLTAKNALVIGVGALSAWYCVRKVKS